MEATPLSDAVPVPSYGTSREGCDDVEAAAFPSGEKATADGPRRRICCEAYFMVAEPFVAVDIDYGRTGSHANGN
eukprot:CAMPEP_0203886284 /NCGR_PEP_ID=MMETSP0359-20131031/30119_1 /ASSEMBLY_ACC=CAM_ASM_000338 /TAXON_ID=268821 /ORGANISM="Scrippsiella Hangoei, Strain SHTV-5" /LENGTH=74 /DNA_ID=CAMNT_0050807081 /DNA_START=54 /DNA_END=278 /DNA_ORIENTATION=-